VVYAAAAANDKVDRDWANVGVDKACPLLRCYVGGCGAANGTADALLRAHIFSGFGLSASQ
jgi:hypothetical protein